MYIRGLILAIMTYIAPPLIIWSFCQETPKEREIKEGWHDLIQEALDTLSEN